jgi:ribosomal protein S18 acetylase RimI-like enzyme
MLIRECETGDAVALAELVSRANLTVAELFGLNAENCPGHPSLCTAAWIEAGFARGETYFMLGDIACVAYESPEPGRAYLNRLSVLPAHRRSGAGAQLVGHVVAHARARGVTSISIGVIGQYAELQDWYRKLGFVDGDTRHFAHLPFAVKYMTLALT